MNVKDHTVSQDTDNCSFDEHHEGAMNTSADNDNLYYELSLCLDRCYNLFPSFVNLEFKKFVSRLSNELKN